MKYEEVLPNVFHINFPSQEKLASTFLRFQEHFESPSFKGKIFSLDDFKYWYTKNSPNGKKTDQFTYYSDWSGFNIPSETLIPFQDGLFDPLSLEEIEFLELFKSKKHPFYIIGTYGDEKKSLKHELAHALFYTNEEYRNSVLAVIHEIPDEFKELFVKALESSAAYHYSVYLDELQAYLVSGLEKLKESDLDLFPFLRFEKKLKIIFDSFLSKK